MALNEVFVPLLQQQFSEIVDFYLPPEGCSYRVAVVPIKKAYPDHAKCEMLAFCSYLHQFMDTKWVIVVDDDINARTWDDVIWASATRMDPARDITLVENAPIDYFDFAAPESCLGSKIGLDATNIWPRYGLPGSGKSISDCVWNEWTGTALLCRMQIVAAAPVEKRPRDRWTAHDP